MKPCPTDQLQLLIRDELTEHDSQELQTHLSSCQHCQQELESLAAEESWWHRATRSLSGATDVNLPFPSASDSILVRIDQPIETTPESTTILETPSHPEMLGRIDQFDVEEKIGQGGMGIVFRGFDSALNRPVAIKVLAPHLASSGVARKRFAREAQAAAAVVHPNVVPIYSVKDSAHRPYIVMALVDGRSLQEHVHEQGPLPLKELVRIAHQIAAGLAEAHKQGLIHRDIKPANILLEKDVSRALLTDFGLARAADDVAMTQTGWLAGTPHYMSPEQAKGKDIDRRSDLFSLGSVMYFMATGREPFRAEKPLAILQKIDQGEPLPARNINSEIPKTLDRIIGRLLEKHPDHRIESAEKLEQLLARYLAHLQHPQSITKPKVRSTKFAKQKGVWLAGGAALVILSLVITSIASWLSQAVAPSVVADSSANASPQETSSDWMEGLQSFEDWARDAQSLEQDVDLLEQEIGTRWPTEHDSHNSAVFRFPSLDGQFQQIEDELQQLESPRNR